MKKVSTVSKVMLFLIVFCLSVPWIVSCLNRNPDGLSRQEGYELVKEKLTDDLKAEFVDMFGFIIGTYPGYRHYSYYPDDEQPMENPKYPDTMYINKNSFNEEDFAYIEGVVKQLGVLHFGITVDNTIKGVFFLLAEGEYQNERVALYYYPDGPSEDMGSLDLGDGWVYSYMSNG